MVAKEKYNNYNNSTTYKCLVSHSEVVNSQGKTCSRLTDCVGCLEFNYPVREHVIPYWLAW